MSTQQPRRKPWFHAPSGFWCAQIAGKRHYLDRDPVIAQRKLNKLLAEQQRSGSGGREWLDASFSELADQFLDDVRARREPATYENYRDMLELALAHLGTGLKVGAIRKLHLTKLDQALHGSYSSTTIFKAIHAVQRVFNWAVENDFFEYSPLVGYKKPRPRQRNRIIDPEEFQAMLRCSDAAFRRVLLALRLTGCRPGELGALNWEHVDLDAGVWVLPQHKTITRQKHPRPRVIALPGPILRLMQWFARQPHQPGDPVFRNTRGRRWTVAALHSRQYRLRPKAGLQPKAGEQIVLYSARHSFATDAVGKVSDIELAALMGHEGPATTRRYVHLNYERLREIRKRAQG